MYRTFIRAAYFFFICAGLTYLLLDRAFSFISGDGSHNEYFLLPVLAAALFAGALGVGMHSRQDRPHVFFFTAAFMPLALLSVYFIPSPVLQAASCILLFMCAGWLFCSRYCAGWSLVYSPLCGILTALILYFDGSFYLALSSESFSLIFLIAVCALAALAFSGFEPGKKAFKYLPLLFCLLVIAALSCLYYFCSPAVSAPEKSAKHEAAVCPADSYALTAILLQPHFTDERVQREDYSPVRINLLLDEESDLPEYFRDFVLLPYEICTVRTMPGQQDVYLPDAEITLLDLKHPHTNAENRPLTKEYFRDCRSEVVAVLLPEQDPLYTQTVTAAMQEGGWQVSVIRGRSASFLCGRRDQAVVTDWKRLSRKLDAVGIIAFKDPKIISAVKESFELQMFVNDSSLPVTDSVPANSVRKPSFFAAAQPVFQKEGTYWRIGLLCGLLTIYLAARYFIGWSPCHKPRFRSFEIGCFIAGILTLYWLYTSLIPYHYSFFLPLIPALFLFAARSFRTKLRLIRLIVLPALILCCIPAVFAGTAETGMFLCILALFLTGVTGYTEIEHELEQSAGTDVPARIVCALLGGCAAIGLIVLFAVPHGDAVWLLLLLLFLPFLHLKR